MFITFEGLDGAGKTTQIERLTKRLRDRGERVLTTREPGGTDIGDAIRQMLLDPAQQQMAQTTEALLYASSRAQLIAQVIVPALAAGTIVVCDRYVDASLAYQGAGLGLGVDAVASVNAFATQHLEPDLTLLMDLTVEGSQSRVYESRAETAPDRIERRNSDYFTRVRNEFLRIANDNPGRVVVLDATKAPDVLEEEIWQAVAKYL